jgi:hypothetical protein
MDTERGAKYEQFVEIKKTTDDGPQTTQLYVRRRRPQTTDHGPHSFNFGTVEERGVLQLNFYQLNVRVYRLWSVVRGLLPYMKIFRI